MAHKPCEIAVRIAVSFLILRRAENNLGNGVGVMLTQNGLFFVQGYVPSFNVIRLSARILSGANVRRHVAIIFFFASFGCLDGRHARGNFWPLFRAHVSSFP